MGREKLTETLEKRVAKRTKELAQSNAKLERFNRLAVGREERMLELKGQVNELSKALGKPPPYDLSFLQKGSSGGIHEDA